MQPKVSVIIPVYNVEKYLRQCLDSVVNQTLKDIEIICVDDGSTDNSLNILKEYAAKDDRFIILEQKNQGSASARNNAFNSSKGEYIGFIDSDDFVSKNYFESLYNSAKKQDADICATNKIILCERDKQIIKKCGIENNDKELVSMYAKSKIVITTGVSCNKIYRKQFLIENNIKYLEINNPAEDNYFTDIAVICANKIAINNKCSYYYVIHNNSQTQKLKTKEDFKIFEIYKNIENKILEMPISNSEKSFWQIVINQRKRQDFNTFYNTMAPEFQNEFKLLAEKNLGLNNIILSITSYPARINTVHKVVESLLNQTYKVGKIILWLSDTQFPNKEKDLPQQLLDLVSQGLTIDWCEDIKSYKKLIPTLWKYPDSIIVTADDDLIYDKNCIKSLVDTYIKYPNCIIANRAHYITFKKGKIELYKNWDFSTNYKLPSFNMLFTGVGAVLYPPNCFYKDILNENLFMSLSKNTDDIWFWAMAVLNGTKIKLAEPNYSRLNYIDGTQDTGLYHNNLGGGNNDKNIKLMLEHYPELLEKLDKDNGLYSNKLEKIFSVKNRNGYKVITILGIKFKFKSKKLIERKKVANLENNVKSLIDKIDKQENNITKLETLLQNQNDCIKNLTKQINEHKNQLQNQERQHRYELCKYMHPDMYPVYLKDWYKKTTGETLNLENPQTFNEKIQWLKLYDSTPLKTRLADKYLVRDWVKEKIGEEYLIPLLGVWDNFDEIDFDKLPNQFVLKCNHGCGYNIIVNDKSKFNKEDARRKIDNWMNEDFAFRCGLELHYSAIPRKIIAEKYIENSGNDLYDYKFWCFDGKVKYIQFLSERNTNGLKMAFYDKNWEKQDFVYSYPLDSKNIPRPENLEIMVYLAEKLAEGFNHVRVDFYRLEDSKVYFGEMTFTSCSGVCKWIPETMDMEFGQLIELPINKKEYVNC